MDIAEGIFALLAMVLCGYILGWLRGTQFQHEGIGHAINWMKACEARQEMSEEAIRGIERELEFSQGYEPTLTHREGME